MLNEIEKNNLMLDFCKFVCGKESPKNCSKCRIEEFLNYFKEELCLEEKAKGVYYV